MNKLLTFFTVLFPVAAFSQISIDNSDMPAGNDTPRISHGQTTGINYTATGASHTWDFSHLKPSSQEVITYKSALMSPYAIHFMGLTGYKASDNLNLGLLSIENIWNFQRTSSAYYRMEGFGYAISGLPSAMKYTDYDEIYILPITYGDTSGRTFRGKTSIPSLGDLIIDGKRNNTVDGWGTLITPYDTFDCIRVRSEVIETDSLAVTALGGIKIPVPNNRTEYKWLAKGERIPVLEIIVTQGIMGSTISDVKYRDIYRYIKPTPVVKFYANDSLPKVNSTQVQFTDFSSDAEKWKWTFIPNTISYMQGTSDTSANPVVRFNNTGTYTVRLAVTNTSGSTTLNKPAYITAGDVPTVRFRASKTNAVTNEVITITDSSTNKPDSWKWTIQPASHTYVGSTDVDKIIYVKFSATGYYNVRLQAANYWGNNMLLKNNYILVTQNTGIKDNKNLALSTFPDPVNDELHITLDKQCATVKISVLSVDGRLISTELFRNTNEISINTSQLLNGYYILLAETGGQVFPMRFIKN